MQKTGKYNKLCRSCYFGGLTGTGTPCCNRYVMLGKEYRRNCPVGLCDKFLRKDATEEEIEANKKLNEVEYENKNIPTRDNETYHNYYFGKRKAVHTVSKRNRDT